MSQEATVAAKELLDHGDEFFGRTRGQRLPATIASSAPVAQLRFGGASQSGGRSSE
jgi:hypothetical protein